MSSDPFGNYISTGAPDVHYALSQFAGAYLAYRKDGFVIVEMVDHYPEEPLLNAYMAMLMMFTESPEGPQLAAPYAEKACAARHLADPREQLNVDYAVAWVRDDGAGMEQIAQRVMDENPTDLVILKTHQYHMFNRGDAPAMLYAAKRAASVLPDNPHVLAMLAFGYEQCHLIPKAAAAARAALEIQPTEPWAQHALAHVYLTQGRISEGCAFLEERQSGWGQLNSFMVTHLYWHLALFYMSQGREADVLALYDAQIFSHDRHYSQDQIGAVSLLARMELAGQNVGGRWQDLAPYLQKRTADVVQPFLTVQYILGLAKAGCSEAQALQDTVENHARTAPPVWRDVAVPLGQAMLAYAHRGYSECYRLLLSCLPLLANVGGSHAQRDLFEQILIDSAVKSGALVHAQQLLELRRQMDPENVPLNRLLASVYRKLRLPDEAQMAEARASKAAIEFRR
jgi:hypothetical protein